MLENPERIEASKFDPVLKSALGPVPAHGNRVLRVVYNEKTDPPQIVTVESEEVRPGIVLDFNSSKEVVGIEVLGVRRRVPAADPKQLKFEVA